jgi:hypothetical protein
MMGFVSIDSWHNSPANAPAVLLPVGAVFRLAPSMILPLTLKQQNQKVREVKVGQGVLEQTGQAPR